MIIEIFQLAMLASFCQIGLFTITRHGHIFGFVEDFMDSKKWKLSNPISECPVCMTSITGTLIYAGYFLWIGKAEMLALIPVFWLATAGITEVLSTLIWGDA